MRFLAPLTFISGPGTSLVTLIPVPKNYGNCDIILTYYKVLNKIGEVIKRVCSLVTNRPLPAVIVCGMQSSSAPCPPASCPWRPWESEAMAQVIWVSATLVNELNCMHSSPSLAQPLWTFKKWTKVWSAPSPYLFYFKNYLYLWHE